jgi:phospholipid transport system transporter-binding protein
MIERDGERLRVQGALTMDSILETRAAGVALMAGDAVVVDLAGVTEVDSSALSLLLEWRREARRRDVRLAICNLPDNLKSLAELYGVTELVAASGEPA